MLLLVNFSGRNYWWCIYGSVWLSAAKRYRPCSWNCTYGIGIDWNRSKFKNQTHRKPSNWTTNWSTFRSVCSWRCWLTNAAILFVWKNCTHCDANGKLRWRYGFWRRHFLSDALCLVVKEEADGKISTHRKVVLQKKCALLFWVFWILS